MKTCLDCGKTKVLSEFYVARTSGQVLSYCKACHNRKCRNRVKKNPQYRARQMALKRDWERRNPDRKRLHEGRLIFTASAPSLLQQCERLVWEVTGEACKASRREGIEQTTEAKATA